MIKVVVPISGGKDSQACLKLAIKSGRFEKSEILGLFCDTKFEHQKTYTHINQIEKLYGVEVRRVNAGSVEEKILKYNRFPSGTARFCTEELKIWPTKIFLRDLAIKQNQGFEVWYGMRSDESSARAKRYIGKVQDEVYAPHEVLRKYPKYLNKLGVSFRLAILNWTTEDVFEFLDGEQNPLYAEGFDRVGCFPCLAAGDAYKAKAFLHDSTGRTHYEQIIRLENITKKSVFTTKNGSANFELKRQNSIQSEDKFDKITEFQGCSICAI